MKWVFSNGLYLVVRDIGPILMKLEMSDKSWPLPLLDPLKTIEDDEARDLVKKLLSTKKYKRAI